MKSWGLGGGSHSVWQLLWQDGHHPKKLFGISGLRNWNPPPPSRRRKFWSQPRSGVKTIFIQWQVRALNIHMDLTFLFFQCSCIFRFICLLFDLLDAPTQLCSNFALFSTIRFLPLSSGSISRDRNGDGLQVASLIQQNYTEEPLMMLTTTSYFLAFYFKWLSTATNYSLKTIIGSYPY
jgi:hypothetical protein